MAFDEQRKREPYRAGTISVALLPRVAPKAPKEASGTSPLLALRRSCRKRRFIIPPREKRFHIASKAF